MTNIETQICEHSFRLKRYVESKCRGQKELAEDLYGDAMLIILTKVRIGKLKNSSSLEVFMLKCAKTAMSNYFKIEAARKRLFNNDYIYCVNTSGKSPERKYEIKEENKRFMERAERELNTVYRKILILSLFQDMDRVEIANTLGVCRETASVYLSRMRKKFGDIHLNKYREFSKES